MRPSRDMIVSIGDHRGNECEPIAGLSSRPSMFPFRRAEVPLDPRSGRLLLIALVAWVVSVSLMVLLAALALVATTGTAWRALGVLWIPMLAGILVAMLASNLAQRRASAHWRNGGRCASAALLAARGWCPSCYAWLASIPRDADGMTTCSACSTAWRVGNAEGCPSCGYDMSRVPATAGPLAICPECATLSVASAPPR